MAISVHFISVQVKTFKHGVKVGENWREAFVEGIFLILAALETIRVPPVTRSNYEKSVIGLQVDFTPSLEEAKT